MPEKRLAGAIVFNFDDTTDIERDLLAIKNAELQIMNSEISGADPSDLGWAHSEGELTDWSASAIINMDLVAGEAEVSQAEIERLAFTRAEFPIDFSVPTGALYSGNVFVRGFAVSSADERVQEIRIDLRGTGVLSPVNVT